MERFADTDAGRAFVATADSRRTSPEVMEAIAFFARDEAEAVSLWDGDAIGTVAHLSDIWEHATGNGRISDEDLLWSDRSFAVVMTEDAARYQRRADRLARGLARHGVVSI